MKPGENGFATARTFAPNAKSARTKSGVAA